MRTKSDPSYVILKTFMNNSGAAVRDLLQKAACTPEEILVCYDDFDLAVGTLRIRKKGSPGTHNGMKSITECLATENFPRLRLGCGPADGDPADYVLRPIAKSQQKDYEAMLDRAALALEAIVKDGLEKAMNGFNAK